MSVPNSDIFWTFHKAMAFPEKVKQRALELYQGRSAAKAQKILEVEFPPQDVPNEKTIRRWKKEAVPLSIPSAQFWNSLSKSEQKRILKTVKAAGKDPDDYLDMIKRLTPGKPSEITPHFKR